MSNFIFITSQLTFSCTTASELILPSFLWLSIWAAHEKVTQLTNLNFVFQWVLTSFFSSLTFLPDLFTEVPIFAVARVGRPRRVVGDQLQARPLRLRPCRPPAVQVAAERPTATAEHLRSKNDAQLKPKINQQPTNYLHK